MSMPETKPTVLKSFCKEPLDHEVSTRLEHLVGTLTNNGGKQLESKVMKEVKSICRQNESYVEHVFHLLMTELRREHSEVRYVALLITDELFNRSHKFRQLILSEFQEFLELTAETDSDYPLPPPKAAAKDLKEKTLEYVNNWYKKFHEGYKLLGIGYNFLKDCKMVDFTNLEIQSSAQHQEDQNRQRRIENVLKESVLKTTTEMNELVPEINCLLKQMENCLNILVPQWEDIFDSTDFENKSAETGNCQEAGLLRQHGIQNRSDCNLKLNINHSGICVEKNDDTEACLDQLKEFLGEVEHRFLPSVTKWLQVFTKGSCLVEIKKTIDLKQKLNAASRKCRSLHIQEKKMVTSHNDDEASDDDEFEVVKEKEGFEPIIPQHKRLEYGMEALESSSSLRTAPVTPRLWQVRSESKEEVKDPTTLAANIKAITNKFELENTDCSLLDQPSTSKGVVNKRKSNLLSKAPKIPYGVDLYHWEDEKLEAPTIVKFDSLHKFWHPSENELTERQAEEGVAALRRRYIDFSGKFEPVKWMCRAPLPNGKLCSRQDRIKCPFHGKVIPRDIMGNPTTGSIDAPGPSKGVEEVIPDWQDPQLLKEIEAATGIDLKLPKKRGKPGKGKGKSKAGAKSKAKDSNLTNIKTYKNTTRKRLEKKVLNKESVKRVSATLDSLDRKKYFDKFGHQWNYSFST